MKGRGSTGKNPEETFSGNTNVVFLGCWLHGYLLIQLSNYILKVCAPHCIKIYLKIMDIMPFLKGAVTIPENQKIKTEGYGH